MASCDVLAKAGDVNGRSKNQESNARIFIKYQGKEPQAAAAECGPRISPRRYPGFPVDVGGIGKTSHTQSRRDG